MKRLMLKLGIVAGVLLALAPMFGMLGSTFAMIGAFRQLGQTGIADPSVLSAQMGKSVSWTIWGLLYSPLGLAVLVPCILALRKLNRETPPELPR